MHFMFGQTTYGRPTVILQATSLPKAIRLFRVGTLFPHQYSTEPVGEKRMDERGYDMTVYLSSKPGAVVPVHASPTGHGDWTLVAEILPEDPESDALTPAAIATKAHLPIDPTAVTSQDTQIALAGVDTGLPTLGRRAAEERMLELQAAMGSLERQKRELQMVVQALRSELKHRMEQIWMIELFLGSQEEVRQLKSGAPAPASERIAVRQRVLCMDEEMAVWQWLHDPDSLGEFDYTCLEDFDRWVCDPEHLAEICPYPKGMVGLRVRRHSKERPSATSLQDMFQNIEKDEADRSTYLLVRNGENLYRLWVDIDVFPRLFASEKDTAPSADEHFSSWDERQQQDKLKHHVAGLLVLQGLLDRSDLFRPLPAPRVNAFDPMDVERFFNLVRDDEERRLLADGTDDLAHLSWRGYQKWLRTQLQEGCRVFWLGERDHERYALYNRTGLHTIMDWPMRGEIFTLDAYPSKSTPWSILYRPVGGWRDRTRRVRFRVYPEEVLPVDSMSWRVLEHLIRDRGQRANYGEFFRLSFDWWKWRKEEAALESPFVDLVLARAGVDQADEAERARCERLLRWWKMKVQIHRVLVSDDAKALRMVEKAFKNGADIDDDPERALLASLGR